MHRDLITLLELQQTDLRIGELSAQIEGLPSRIQTAEAQLAEFHLAHDESQKKLAANQKERRELEGELQLIKEKISKHKDQLYEVKTNEQYRAMIHEIEGEEGNIRAMEDKILEKMIEAEGLQTLIKESAARLESETKRVAAEKARLQALQKEDLQEREELTVRRKELSATLTASLREVYERVRGARGGVALAEVRGGLCMGCNVLLRPQLYNEVRANESLRTCENCLRILYYRDPAPAEAQSEGAQAAAESSSA